MEPKEQPRSRCKGCNQPIIWRQSLASGKMMPIDPDPDPEGNVILSGIDGFRTLRSDEDRRGMTIYQSHFTTCPHRAKFKRAR